MAGSPSSATPRAIATTISEVFVHDTFDKSVTFETTNGEVVDIEEKELDGRTGFTLVPGQELGDATIVIQSVRNDDVRTEIPVSLKTIKVTGVALSLNEDGSEASDALAGKLTVSHTKAVRVVFSTDDEEIKIPENSRVSVESSNTAVATVDAEGTQDPATQTVSFNVYMIDDPANAPEGTSTITVKTDDGSYEATFTVTAQCPGVQQIVLGQALSEPILAGQTLQMTYKTVPEDAYVQTVQWSSADESVATVDANGLVTVKADFRIRPGELRGDRDSYHGHLRRRQRRRRVVQTAPVSIRTRHGRHGDRPMGATVCAAQHDRLNHSSPNDNYACIVYCSGGGTAKKTQFNDTQSWAVASPAVEGIDKVGSVPFT